MGPLVRLGLLSKSLIVTDSGKNDGLFSFLLFVEGSLVLGL